MKRRLLNLLTALSLLVCVAVVALWVRSLHTADVVLVTSSHGTFGASTAVDGNPAPGRIAFEYSEPSEGGRPGFAHHAAAVRDHPHISFGSTLDVRAVDLPGGFAFRNAGTPGTLFEPSATRRVVVAPLWSVALLALVPPSLWLARRRRRRCVSVDFCPHCAYDLRATPDRCPECGHTPEGATA